MWTVVSYRKNGSEQVSQPMHWDAAYRLWERKQSRSARRFSIRRA
jgi:hypothetical protein